MNTNITNNMTGSNKRPTNRTRKSTLTQQQKNKKRQRATTEQLEVLKKEFLINQTPNAKTREEIGRRIDMTERSVQIWFQNKRAKTKQNQRKNGYMSGQTTPFVGNHIYNNMSLIGQLPVQLPMAGNYPNFMGHSLTPFGSHLNPMLHQQQQACNKMSISTTPVVLSCSELWISNWRRVFDIRAPQTLQIKYEPMDSTFSYTICEPKSIQDMVFNMKFPKSSIESIELTSDDSNPIGGMVTITLNEAPRFLIKSPATSDTWQNTCDFSMNGVASKNFTHKLKGNMSTLTAQLMGLAFHIPVNILGVIYNEHNAQHPLFCQSFRQAGTMSEAVSPGRISEITNGTTSSVDLKKSRSHSLPSLLTDETRHHECVITNRSFVEDEDATNNNHRSLNADNNTLSNSSNSTASFFSTDEGADSAFTTLSTPDIENFSCKTIKNKEETRRSGELNDSIFYDQDTHSLITFDMNGSSNLNIQGEGSQHGISSNNILEDTLMTASTQNSSGIEDLQQSDKTNNMELSDFSFGRNDVYNQTFSMDNSDTMFSMDNISVDPAYNSLGDDASNEITMMEFSENSALSLVPA